MSQRVPGAENLYTRPHVEDGSHVATAGRSLTDALVRRDGDLIYKRFTFTKTGLALPDDTQEVEWSEVGMLLAHLEGALQWWIGDWLTYGERAWKYTYETVATRFGFQVETLYVYASVARNINSLIRNQDLSFSHHRLIQGLTEGEQKRWLALAAENRWTLKQFGAMLKSVQSVVDESAEYGWIVDPERFPKLTPGRIGKLVNEAVKGDEKAAEILWAELQRTRQWLTDVEALFGKP